MSVTAKPALKTAAQRQGEGIHITELIPLCPVTKKNSQRIVKARGRYIPLPSEQYTRYERDAGVYLRHKHAGISMPVNVKCLFYMGTRRRVDLVNLLEAVDDMLVTYGVIADDNSGIVAAHDGSRVLYDKNSPRTEIEITQLREG